MSFRTVVFDVYRTLLEVGPPPADAALRWERLWREQFQTDARLTLEAFDAECRTVIAREHQEARVRGIRFPEIFWPAVAGEVLPGLAALSAEARGDFLFQHAQMVRTVRLMPGAGEVLRALSRRGIPLGIASNAQPYTLRELDGGLAEAGLSREIFTPGLCFWSFENGFSKPEPSVFRLLSARLAGMEIRPGEAVMVGDRVDNDIAPAHAQGWQTWHLDASPAHRPGGGWGEFGEWLGGFGV